jgi:hypothetical protein
MSRMFQSRLVFAIVCALSALAITASVLAGCSMPAFGAGWLSDSGFIVSARAQMSSNDRSQNNVAVSQSPFSPPDPGPQEVKVAQSPFPPPDPGPQEVKVAQSPFPPPDPGPQEVKVG